MLKENLHIRIIQLSVCRHEDIDQLWIKLSGQVQALVALSLGQELRVSTKQEHEYCTLLGYYAVNSGNFLAKFRDNLFIPSARDY